MSTVSGCLTALADHFKNLEATGVTMEPEAIQSVRQLIEELSRDAAKLERMLERRLRAANVSSSIETGDIVPAPQLAGTVLPFTPRAKPRAPQGGDAA